MNRTEFVTEILKLTGHKRSLHPDVNFGIQRLIDKREKDLEEKIEKYEKTLKIVRDWKLPETWRYWDGDKNKPMSYEEAYGSNGARDYMRKIAMKTLEDSDT